MKLTIDLLDIQYHHFIICDLTFCEVTVTLTFDHQNLIISSLSPSGCMCQIWGNPLKVFLRCRIHKRMGWTNRKHNTSSHGCHWWGGIKLQKIVTPQWGNILSMNFLLWFKDLRIYIKYINYNDVKTSQLYLVLTKYWQIPSKY